MPVAATTAMADARGPDVVAQAVETQSALREVRELGCDLAQGFLLARPSAARAIDARSVEAGP